MRTPILPRFLLLPVLTIAALGIFSLPASAQNTPDLPVVSIRSGASAPEYCPPNADCAGINFLLTRTGPGLENPLRVWVGYYGTALTGIDYQLPPYAITFPAGQDRISIYSQPIDDLVYEGDETVEARLLLWNTSSANQYVISSSNATATVTILDNDPPRLPPLVSLELVRRDAMETLIYQNAIIWAEFRVHRIGTASNELMVYLNTTQGSARLGQDYWLDDVTNGTVRIPAGFPSVTVRLYPIDDSFYEDDETVFFHLIAPPAGTPLSGQYEINFAHSAVAMVIHDNDPVETRLDITAPLNGQRFEAGAIIELRAQVIGPGKSNVWDVTFFDGIQPIGTTRPGAAIWWSDATGGQHVINARATDSAGTTLTAFPATIQVGDGPPLPLPIVSITTPSWPETTSEPCPTCLVAPGVLTISRNGLLTEPLTVYLEADGTATPGADYQPLPHSVTIPAGTNATRLLVLPFDDLLVEGPEVVRVSIARPPELATLGYLFNEHASEAFVVIRDDEPGAPAARLDIIEPKDGAQFAVGSAIRVSALGVYANGEISRPVEFYAGNTLIGRSTPSPFARPFIPYLPSIHTIVWTNPPAGQHVLTARSQLSLDEWVQSAPVKITVGGEPPTVPIVSIRATAPETREPLCDPAICDAALPAPGVFVVSRFGGDLSRELSVFIRYQGTATSDTDYRALPNPVLFPAGASMVELFVEASHDTLAEGDETVIAELQPDPSLGPVERYRVDPAHASARVVIHDNDVPPGPVVSIEATSPIAEESSYPYRRLPLRGQFIISRTGPTDNALPVFVHYSGTATPGVDYPALPWLVSIPAGTNSIELEVVPNPDDKPEPIETVDAMLSQCPPLTEPPLGVPCYEVNIDPARAGARVFIRDDGITIASLEITAPKDGAEFSEGTPIRIAATALDLEGAITHVEFFAGDTKIGDSVINFFREPDPGTPIHHEFEWRGAPAGPHVLTTRAIDSAGNSVTSAPVRITVGGEPPFVPIVSIHATRAETQEPLCPPNTCLAPVPAPGVFTITRRGGDLTHGLIVFLRCGGSAVPRADYEPLPESVEIPAGKESVELFVTAHFDELTEGDETVVAALQPDPSLGPIERYRVDPTQATARVIIHDRTPPTRPIVSISAPDAFAREGTNSNTGVNTATFVVSRAGPTNDPLAVGFSVSGTASNGVDYSAISSPLTIPAGHRSARIVIHPIEDNVPEREETVVVTLLESDSAASGYNLGTPRRAAAVIVDNDRPRPKCSRLPDGCFNLCVSAEANQCFRIEATRDFKAWTPVCTVPVNEGAAHYVDPDADTAPQKFYRLVPVACDLE